MVIDSGADTNCADKTLRKCLGVDKLPDAPTGLQGATGKGDDRSINKLRVVTMDNEITVLESSCIENLGYNSPNSDLFWSCVKNKLGINDKKEVSKMKRHWKKQ